MYKLCQLNIPTCRALLAGTSAFTLLCLDSASAALFITNGDFETDTFAGVESGAVDITGWNESNPTGAYVEWLRDGPANHGSATGGAAVAAANNWVGFSGNAAGIAPIFIHQSIGTLSAGTTNLTINGVSSDRGGRAGAGRHAAIVQVGLWFDDGTAIVGNGTELGATLGLSLIGTQSVGATVGGVFSAEGGGAPDINLLTLSPAGQALSEAWQMQFDLSGTGVSEGDTVYFQVRYFDSDKTNSRSEAFIDTLSVVESIPEPSVVLLGGFGLLGLLRRRRV